MALTSSMEDYLEAVLILHQKHGSVRGVDIAVHLGVTKPSVSRAVKELSKSGHIIKNTDGTLSLTDSGLQIATQIYEKHLFFTKQLIEAGVPEEIAKRTPASWNTLSARKAAANIILQTTISILQSFPR